MGARHAWCPQNDPKCQYLETASEYSPVKIINFWKIQVNIAHILPNIQVLSMPDVPKMTLDVNIWEQQVNIPPTYRCYACPIPSVGSWCPCENYNFLGTRSKSWHILHQHIGAKHAWCPQNDPRCQYLGTASEYSPNIQVLCMPDTLGGGMMPLWKPQSGGGRGEGRH